MTICKHETQQLIRLTQRLSYDIENPEFILVDGILVRILHSKTLLIIENDKTVEVFKVMLQRFLFRASDKCLPP